MNKGEIYVVFGLYTTDTPKNARQALWMESFKRYEQCSCS